MAGRCLGPRMLKLLPRAGAAKELHQQGQEPAAPGLPGHGTQGGPGDAHHASPVLHPRGAWASCSRSRACFALRLCRDSSLPRLLRLWGLARRCWQGGGIPPWFCGGVGTPSPCSPAPTPGAGGMARRGMPSTAPREKSGAGREEARAAKLLSCNAGREGRRGCRGRGIRLLCKQQLLFPPFQQLIRI